MLRLVILVSLALAATPVAAATLSAVPLAIALKNPALVDTKSTEFPAAFEQVTRQLLNQPDKAELETAQARAAALARHRDTRVGKLFFAALAALPQVENLGEAEFAAIETTWPIALGADIRVRVEFTRRGETWLISALETTAHGVAAAPLAGMAPYFGLGAPRPELLDLEALDYLVGRDPDDRQKLEADRKAFDFDAALVPLFEAEAGAFADLLDTLAEAIKPGTGRDKRIAALKPHLATKEDAKAMEEADADESRREAFWTTLREQVASAKNAPRPAAVPKSDGAQVKVRWKMAGSKQELQQSASRLETGKLAFGG